jgi:hypothetical protein
MCAMTYVISYRAYRPGGTTALLLEDAAGLTYLFSDGTLQCAFRGPQAVERLCALIPTVVWCPVPPVAPYSLSELVPLVSGSASPSVAQLAA